MALMHDPFDIPPGSHGYAQNAEDVVQMQAAGLGAFREVRHTHRPVATKGGPVDFSLLQPGIDKNDGMPRLDPSAFKLPAGGIPKKADEMSTVKVVAETDPITHFKHLKKNWAPVRGVGKKMGYAYGAGAQTWTWSQDPKVVQSLGLVKEHTGNTYQKFAVGANGQRYFNMFGREDLAPAAKRAYIKCDRPANDDLISFNDRENLAYCLREGSTERRLVHDYWRSDDLWGVMRDEAYMKVLRDECKKAGLAGKSGKEMREPSLSSEDECIELMPRSSQHKENSPPDGLLGNDVLQGRWMEEVAQQKNAPWMALEVACGASPRGTTPSDAKGPSLSMTPRSVNRRDATPRSMTPRSSIVLDATPRASYRHAACQVDGLSARAATPRRELVPGNTTPQGTPRDALGTRPRGDATPRCMTPRSSAGQGRAALSMTPRLISRRDLMPNGTPRGSTPGGSMRGMRRSASEVVLRHNA